MSLATYNFGWDEAKQEFILWKRGRKSPVAVIPLSEIDGLTSTVAHVKRNLRKAEEAADEQVELWHIPAERCPMNDLLAGRPRLEERGSRKRIEENLDAYEVNIEMYGCKYEIRPVS